MSKFFYSVSTGWHVIEEEYISLLPADCIEKTEAEHQAYVESLSIKSDEIKLVEFKAEVQSALDKTDQVAIRAFKAGVAFNSEWAQCVEKLREQMAITEWSDDLTVTPLPTTYPS